MKERTKNLNRRIVDVARDISANPGEVEGGGTLSTGRKSLRKVSMGTGPTKECRISESKGKLGSSTMKGK